MKALAILVLSLFVFGKTLAQDTFKLGIVSFLSGPAAESFGVPAVNGAKVVLEAFNKGAAPAPYDKVGFGGVRIEAVYVDENGGAPVHGSLLCVLLPHALVHSARQGPA